MEETTAWVCVAFALAVIVIAVVVGISSHNNTLVREGYATTETRCYGHACEVCK